MKSFAPLTSDGLAQDRNPLARISGARKAEDPFKAAAT